MDDYIIKVLLIEDDSEDALILKKFLSRISRHQFVVEWVNRLSQGMDFLQENEVDVILLDLSLPDSFGLETFNSLLEKASTIPVIVLSGMDDEDMAVEAVHLGAQDYMVKGSVNSDLVSRSILYAIERKKIERELKSTKEELERANRQMKEFVGVVSHDLSSPLSSLLQMSTYLNGDDLDEKTKKDLRILMVDTCSRAFELVQDILDLTALETGKIQIYLQKCNMSNLAFQAIRETQFLARKKGVRLINEIQKIFDIQVDKKRITQVLTNLLTNAIKFSPNSESVVVQAVPQENGLRIEVIDNGVGIDPDVIPKLFNKHEKCSTTGTSGEKGTGFGLPLSQELLQLHDSLIEVKSELGKGSCFYFLLPWWKEVV